jgi:DNA-binding CsgD family transcriptional regulator
MGSDDRPADAEPQTPSSPLAQSLSVRESPILKLTAEGLSNKEIGNGEVAREAHLHQPQC